MTIYFCLLVFCFDLVFSQVEPAEIYGGVGYYRHTALDDNSYFHFQAGSEIFSYEFIAPEIDYTFYYGTNEIVGSRDEETNFPNSILKKNFRASLLAVAPKVFIGESDLRLVFIPKYNFGDIKADGFLSTVNNMPIKQEVVTKLKFWSFSLWLEGELGNERLKLGGYFIYTGFDAGKATNQIAFPAFGFEGANTNTSTLGITFRLSYGLWANPKLNK